MATTSNNKATKPVVKTEEKPVSVSFPEQRIHIREFIATYAPNINPMHKAGLQALAKGKEWMPKEHWQELLDKYLGKNK